MAAIIEISEVQTLLQIDDKFKFISDAIPIVQSATDKYFNNTWTDYPACFKRTSVIMIKSMMDNPGLIWREEVGDDEKEFRGLDLSKVFDGLDSLKADKPKSAKNAQFFNLEQVNNNLGI